MTALGAMTGRDIQTFLVIVSPGQRDERRHGQTHFALGAKLGRDGRTAGLCFAAGMTARASGEGIAGTFDGTLPVTSTDCRRRHADGLRHVSQFVASQYHAAE